MAVEVEFNANVSAAAAGATALTIELNGEAIGGTEMDYTVATAEVYQNVKASTLIAILEVALPYLSETSVRLPFL